MIISKENELFMNKDKRFKLDLFIGFLMVLLWWGLFFFHSLGYINVKIDFLFDNPTLGTLLLSIFVLLLLILKKDIMIPLGVFIFTPFVLVTPLTDLTIATSSEENTYFINLINLISDGLVILGFIIHFIRFRPKLRLGSFFICLTISCFVFCLSELKANNGIAYEGLNSVLLALLFLAFYFLLCNNETKHGLMDYTFYFRLMLLLILVELGCSIYFNKTLANDTNQLYITTILFIIPFTLLTNGEKGFKNEIVTLISIVLILASFYLLLQTSTHASLLLLEELLLVIVYFNKSKTKIGCMINNIILLVLTMMVFIFYLEKEELMIWDYFNTIKKSLVTSYENLLTFLSNNTFKGLLGKGVYYYATIDTILPVNVFIKIMICFGILGLISFIISKIVIYFKLLKGRTKVSLISFISFLIMELESLVSDIYFLMPLAILFIFTLGLIEYEVNEKLLCEYGSDE